MMDDIRILLVCVSSMRVMSRAHHSVERGGRTVSL